MSEGQFTNRTKQSQAVHNSIIDTIAKYYLKKGYLVKADHINWKYGAPSDIGGFTPDITAVKGTNLFDSEFLVFEVETEDSYFEEITKQQLTTFSKSKNTYIVIEDKIKDEIQAKLKEWHLDSIVKIFPVKQA